MATRAVRRRLIAATAATALIATGATAGIYAHIQEENSQPHYRGIWKVALTSL